MSAPGPAICVAVVEDRPEDLHKLTKLLGRTPGFECVAACSTAKEALQVLPRCEPDIVLMDIEMPGMSGIDCVRELQPMLPTAQFMMLTVFEDHDRIFRSLAAGATGYLLKSTPPAKLIEAIRDLRAGGAPMSGQIARQVIGAFGQHSRSHSESSAKLTPVERSVLERLGRGLLYKEVADELQISVNTVRTHICNIYRKLQAHNRTEALLKATSGPPL